MHQLQISNQSQLAYHLPLRHHDLPLGIKTKWVSSSTALCTVCQETELQPLVTDKLWLWLGKSYQNTLVRFLHLFLWAAKQI